MADAFQVAGLIRAAVEAAHDVIHFGGAREPAGAPAALTPRGPGQNFRAQRLPLGAEGGPAAGIAKRGEVNRTSFPAMQHEFASGPRARATRAIRHRRGAW